MFLCCSLTLTLPYLYNIIIKIAMEIVPHVYQIKSRGGIIRGGNMILIAEEELTLIDTGLPGSSAKIVNLIHSLGRSIEALTLVLLTHNHPDHVGGLAELRRLTRAKVAAHKADVRDVSSQSPCPSWVVRKLLHVPPFSALKPIFAPELGGVDVQLEGDEVLSPLGGLRVIHTPGHTPGSISLYSPQKKLLIVGDALRKRRQNPCLPSKMASRNYQLAIDSIKRIAYLDFDIMCFGHGRPITKDVSAKVRDLIKNVD